MISLIETHEFENLQIQELKERAANFEIENVWFPIRDQSVPDSMEKLGEIVNRITDDSESGRNVVIHCMGGLGRTGTVAAALLVAVTDLKAEEAIEIVRQARPGTIENRTQEQCVSLFADFCRQEANK